VIYPADLKNRFEYHPANTDQRRELHEAVRTLLLEAAEDIVRWTPPGREQSLAVTKLEEAMFWANAAIARQP
jgi:hypothetical protein